MKKKKKNVFFIVLILLFLVYLAFYVASVNGYYEYQEYNKMVITEEARKEFERDVSEGKDVSLVDYITKKKDYSNNVSELGLKAGSLIEDFVTDGLGSVFEVLGKLVTD